MTFGDEPRSRPRYLDTPVCLYQSIKLARCDQPRHSGTVQYGQSDNKVTWLPDLGDACCLRHELVPNMFLVKPERQCQRANLSHMCTVDRGDVSNLHCKVVRVVSVPFLFFLQLVTFVPWLAEPSCVSSRTNVTLFLDIHCILAREN